MKTYKELRAAHHAELGAFPIKYAFSDSQFAEGMRELGLEPTDTDKIYAWREVNGFYRKSDAEAFHEMLERQERERADAIASDKTGEGYILSMFSYELSNHEYGYTGETTDALEALGLTMDDVNADPRLVHGLGLAINKQTDAFC